MTPLRPCGRDECRLCHPERRVEPADDSLAQALVGTAILALIFVLLFIVWPVL